MLRRSLLVLAFAATAASGCLHPDVVPDSTDPANTERIHWLGPDGRVSALRAGDPQGRRVLFVHGTPGEATNWSPYLVDPPPGVDAVALDRIGAANPSTRRGGSDETIRVWTDDYSSLLSVVK